MTFRPRDARRNPVLLGLLFALALVAGCSKKDKVDPPAELTKLRETIKVQKAWSASVGGPSLRGSSSAMRLPPRVATRRR